MNLPIFSVILVSILIQNGFCDRTSKKIYYDVTTYAMCFRRMNGTHQVGCTSERGGNVGILHYIEQSDEVDWLISHDNHKPYIVLMSPSTFTRENVDKLRKADDLISGIMVEHINITEQDTAPDGFSPDSSCPNSGHDMYAKNDDFKDCRKQEWNPDGNSLMFEDYNFPIVALINYTEVQFLKHDCYDKFNKRSTQGEIPDYPLCAVEVKDAMDGAKDTPTCIRRSNLVTNLNPDEYCDPLGDYSVFGFNRLLNNTKKLEKKSVILAAARLDTFALFDNLYPSADSAISGIVTLLTAAQALAEVSHTQETPNPIMYSLFNGEAFDYIGSSRMIYEMENDRFPYNIDPNITLGPSKVNLENLNSFVEVSQVGLGIGDEYYIHTDPVTYRDPDVRTKVDAMVQELKDLSTGAGVTVQEAGTDRPLPPSSAQSFLKKVNLSGVVIADHNEEYSNRYYNSRYDLASKMGLIYPSGMNASDKYDYETEASTRICKVAKLVARLLYNLSTQSDQVDSITADCSTVRHLLYCMLISPQCELFKEVLDSMDNVKKLAEVPYPLYVSVFIDGSTSRNQITLLTRNLLAYFTGRKLADVTTKGDCDHHDAESKYFDYIWLMGPENSTTSEREGLCVETTSEYSEAKSPAFLIDDYDWSSKEYSTWTESRWGNDAFKVRAFLKPSPKLELGTLCGGIAMLVVSLVLIYIINRRAKYLFTIKE